MKYIIDLTESSNKVVDFRKGISTRRANEIDNEDNSVVEIEIQ